MCSWNILVIPFVSKYSQKKKKKTLYSEFTFYTSHLNVHFTFLTFICDSLLFILPKLNIISYLYTFDGCQCLS